MDKDQLEKLIALLGNNGDMSYRTSSLTKGGEILDLVGAINPELYGHILKEAKRRAEEATGQNAMVKIKSDYIMQKMPNTLKNSVEIQENQQILVYVGEATNLYLLDGNYIMGRGILTKYTKEGRRERKNWRLRTGIPFLGPECVFLSLDKNYKADYRNDLETEAKNKKIILPSDLLSAVFDSLDTQLGEFYQLVKRGEYFMKTKKSSPRYCSHGP